MIETRVASYVQTDLLRAFFTKSAGESNTESEEVTGSMSVDDDPLIPSDDSLSDPDSDVVTVQRSATLVDLSCHTTFLNLLPPLIWITVRKLYQ